MQLRKTWGNPFGREFNAKDFGFKYSKIGAMELVLQYSSNTSSYKKNYIILKTNTYEYSTFLDLPDLPKIYS